MPITRTGRITAAMVAVLLGVAAAASSDDSEGPEEGATVQEVTDGAGVEDDIDATEDQAGAGEDDVAIFEDPESYIGEQVTVSGELSEQLGANAFRISGGSTAGDGLLVFSASEPGDLESDDVVQVQGTVHEVQQDTFEEDFGFGWDEAYAEWEGEAAIAGSDVQVIQEGGE